MIAFGLHAACGLRTFALRHGASPTLANRLVPILTTTATLASALIIFALVKP